MYPILFSIGPIHFHAWGLMMVLGFAAGFQVAKWAAGKAGIDLSHLPQALGFVAVFAIIGSHLMELVINPDLSFTNPSHVFAIWQGLTETGGMLFGMLGLYLYLHLKKLRPLAYLDAFALATPPGLGFGRIGCYLAGCCYGAPTNLPWAITYTDPNSLARPVLGIPVHPAPIYMLIAMWSLFAILLLVRFYAKHDGRVTVAYWIGYPAIRFFQEMIRSDPSRGSWFGGALTGYQMLSLLMLAISVPLAVYLISRPTPEVALQPEVS